MLLPFSFLGYVILCDVIHSEHSKFFHFSADFVISHARARTHPLQIFIICSSVDRQIGWLQLFVRGNETAMKMVGTHLWGREGRGSLGVCPAVQELGHVVVLFLFLFLLRNIQTDFHNGCINLCSRQQ